MRKSAYMIIGSSFNTATDHGVVETVKGPTYVVTVNSMDEAIEKAKALYADGCVSIELCGGFGPEKAQQIVDATDGKLAVSYAVHLPSQDELFKSMFQKK